MSIRYSTDGRPHIVLLDFHTGRIATGHHEDYLRALEEALSGFAPLTLAPFRESQTQAHPLTVRLDPPDKLGCYLYTLKTCRRLLAADEPTLLIFHGPDLRDFVMFALALAVSPRRARTAGVFVMRREAWAIVGRRGLRARLLEASVRWMARSPGFRMASDSEQAMQYWRGVTGKGGVIVSIPTRRPPKNDTGPASGAPVLGLIGGFRLEKGAPFYADVIRCALAESFEVECQAGPLAPGAVEEPLARDLLDRWGHDPRVRIHLGHLPKAAFERMLYGVDVIVLPYDAGSYGPGTSGILFEAAAAGRIIVAARIRWAVESYSGHPNIIWLEGTGGAGLADAIAEAARRVRDRRRWGEAPAVAPDRFQETWLKALGMASGQAADGAGSA